MEVQIKAYGVCTGSGERPGWAHGNDQGLSGCGSAGGRYESVVRPRPGAEV
jgi:hypothetical protein